MKTLENQEIGELLEEMTSKGWTEIKTDVNDTDFPRTVHVEAFNPEESRLDGIQANGATLVECFAEIVDVIRRRRGEPSLAEEVNALIVEQEAHEHTLIQCGPDARCACGSRKPLVVERVFKYLFDWSGGLSYLDPMAPGITMPIQPGERGQCPDCKKWYRLSVG